MNTHYTQKISTELKIPEKQVIAVSELLSQDATIPFIARYRKEATGSLDEVEITKIRNKLDQLKTLSDRKNTILKSLETNNHLTDDLKNKVEEADSLPELEDIYLPYKPKRRTKASIAREKGLEPLALSIMKQKEGSPSEKAQDYLDPQKEVHTIEDALNGANDILAEIISENSTARSRLRDLFFNKGSFVCSVATGKEESGKKYQQYFDWTEPVKTAPSHRVLAMRRGEKETILNLSIYPPGDDAIELLSKIFIKSGNENAQFVKKAIEDSYKRLLSKSMETEIRVKTKEFADRDAIRVFSDNLRQLLLASPLGSKKILGIDPGFRTGCKLVCLNRQGKLLEHTTIFPNISDKKNKEAEDTLLRLCNKHKIEAIAVGNGTAGRETEAFVKKIQFANKTQVILVNESGASIYSASEIAREEFPDIDLTVRGAVSIARRLMDPLSELVKIDPKSIGVGQYQHDVEQNLLKSKLDDVVESCVNNVGVDVNIASAQLLNYVSGLGPVLAKNIVNYRDENGPFKHRKELKKVQRLGPKAFEQSAGFLRINNGTMPLDSSAVHPESYHIVDKMAADLKCPVESLINDTSLLEKINISHYVNEKTGLPTLKDIIGELAKPGRDPREKFQEFSFTSGVDKISDLKEDMILTGIITNITAFGAFVDIGVHQDGLVHISEISDTFVKDLSKVVRVHQAVKVRVLETDVDRKRISLSMRTGSEKKNRPVKKRKKGPATSKTAQKTTGFNNPFADAFNKK